jgi:hypothetical protein
VCAGAKGGGLIVVIILGKAVFYHRRSGCRELSDCEDEALVRDVLTIMKSLTFRE